MENFSILKGKAADKYINIELDLKSMLSKGIQVRNYVL